MIKSDLYITCHVNQLIYSALDTEWQTSMKWHIDDDRWKHSFTQQQNSHTIMHTIVFILSFIIQSFDMNSTQTILRQFKLITFWLANFMIDFNTTRSFFSHSKHEYQISRQNLYASISIPHEICSWKYYSWFTINKNQSNVYFYMYWATSRPTYFSKKKKCKIFSILHSNLVFFSLFLHGDNRFILKCRKSSSHLLSTFAASL